MRLRLLAVSVSSLLQPVFCAPAAAGSPSVTIASGVVVGTTTTLSGATAAASKYVGIPFAASPPQRFGPPKAVPSWTKPLSAVTTRAACIQAFSSGEVGTREQYAFNNPGLPPPEESEDCMYLNVYVPPGANSTSGKAVMFWIYGGNLAFGTGGLGYYDGTSFATKQDVIVVTPNYRTNVFGFPGAPQLRAPYQNPGFLDQRFALNWVQKNIKAFGGDPAKVTIFGESAGGYSVKQLIANPPSPLNFRGAIMESEAALNGGNGTASWEALALGLGCDTTTDQLACMRSKPATQIQSFNQQAGLSYFPMADGKTETTDVRPNFNAGTAAKVPFMIGTNNDEIRVFSWLLGLDQPNPAPITALLAFLFPTNPALQSTLAGIIGGKATYEESAAILTKFAFQCPASMLASFAQGKGYSVHRYLYDAAFPNEALFPDPGVWHSVEIPSVFGTYPEKNALASATPRQRKVSSYMQTAWANFAKNPSRGPGLGWPALGGGKVQNLGGGRSTGGYTIDASSIDQMCALFNPIIDTEGL